MNILPLKKLSNIFERIEIVETIYECVVKLSYKIFIRAAANHARHIRKMRGEVVLSKTYSDMSKKSVKHKKR